MNRLRSTLFACFFLLLLSSCSGPLHLSDSDSLAPPEKGVIQSGHFGIMWQQGRSKVIRSPESAESYADNLSLAGYSDWRLPTKEEFNDLYFSIDFGGANPKDLDMAMTGSFWIHDEDGRARAGEWDSGDT